MPKAVHYTLLRIFQDIFNERGYEFNVYSLDVEMYPDPEVSGVWAVKDLKTGASFIVDLLHETIDEVEFKSWPPSSGRFRFFV